MRNPIGREILRPWPCHRALSQGNMWKGLLAMLVLRKAIVKTQNKSLKFAAATRLGNYIVTCKTLRHALGNLDKTRCLSDACSFILPACAMAYYLFVF